MHIYAFGSVCRGDVSDGSDVDLLAIVDGVDRRFSPDVYSIYSYHRLQEIWMEGNPFAWHLWLESRLLFASDGHDYLRSLGCPKKYDNCLADCQKFLVLFRDAAGPLRDRTPNRVFEMSTIFLSIRNIGTCFSLALTHQPDFSRHAAARLGFDSIPIPSSVYSVLERARLLSTRGHGHEIAPEEGTLVMSNLRTIEDWMLRLLERVEEHERVRQSHERTKANT